MDSYPNKLTPTKSPPAVMWFKVYTGLMALMNIVFFIGGGVMVFLADKRTITRLLADSNEVVRVHVGNIIGPQG